MAPASLPTGFSYHDIVDGQERYFDTWFIRSDSRQRYQANGHNDVIRGQKGVFWLLNGRTPGKAFPVNLHFKVPHRAFMAPGDLVGALEGTVLPEATTLHETLCGGAGRPSRCGSNVVGIATCPTYGDSPE